MSQRQLDTGVNYFKCIRLVTLLIGSRVVYQIQHLTYIVSCGPGWWNGVW